MEERKITPVEPIYKDKAYTGSDDLIKKENKENLEYAEYQRQANEEIRKKMEEEKQKIEGQKEKAPTYQEVYERERMYRQKIKIERDDR